MMRLALSKQSEPPWATSQNQLSYRAAELRAQALNEPSGPGGLEMAKGEIRVNSAKLALRQRIDADPPHSLLTTLKLRPYYTGFRFSRPFACFVH